MSLPSAKANTTSLLDAALCWLGRQRWLRFGLRDRVLRSLRHPEHAGARAFEVPFAGYIYPGQMNRWIDWIVYYYGAYELDELELMRSLVATQRDTVALDIGANVGHHTLYLASFCSNVHAFEPYDAVACSVEEKVQRNKLHHVHLHKVGLSDRPQVLDFYAPQGINTGTGTFVPSHETANNRLVGQMQLVHADAYIATLQLPAVHLIKIDVEGFELSVLRGLRQTLQAHRPVVMMELSDDTRRELADADAFMAMLPEGYRAQVVHSRRSRLVLFGRRGCSLEPMRWHHGPVPGGYMNLLLCPSPA